ncbi:guanine nucleotide exchange factor subunit RIC1-like isoform X2 [Branchiostoma lanceolatum]|uniref:guanine nucleotide exchange factor subunit RIC1-like isoform X2 n=1 Tax=Branchiostoma lanceolatum TaxID=7740 RepID=UPI003453AB5F
MYFPVGWPKALAVPPEDIGGLHSVLCNRDRVLFAVVTERSLAIWYCRPCVQIVCHCRSEESVRTQGTNQRAAWRPDSTSVAVTTSQGHILFYHLEREVVAGHGANCYNQTRGGRFPSMRSSSSMEYGEGVPSIRMTFVTSVQIIGKIECLVCVRDELLVATGNGMLQRLRWDGVVNGKTGINIASIPFSVDLQHSRASTLDTPGITFTHIEYSGLMGGFAVVLPDGRAGLVNTLAGKVENNSLQGVWAQGLENVTCVAVNNRYRLIAFGCTDGLGVVYTVDDMTGALQVSHRLELSTKDYPDACMACGPVSRLRWSPDGCVLAMAWDRGGMAIWSVYGALLMCTLGADQGLYQESLRLHLFRIKSMCWSMEGYQLWMACETLDRSEVMELPTATSELLQLQFVKSTLTVNPCATNHEHLFLQGEDKLFINTGDLVMKQQWKDANMNRPLRESIAGSNTSSPQKPSRQSNILVGNKQWLVIQIPITYLGSNWPIRYAAIDRTGFCIAVAGRCGLAHYAMFTRKWKLFGNETQEKDMVVTGGLTWWRDFIICACYNLNENRDELRMYPRASNLDNAFAYSCKVPSQILLLNLFRDMLVVFCADCHIALYSIERRDANPTPTCGGPSVVDSSGLSIGFGVMDPSASLTLLQEISLASYIPHAVTVISVTLTSLRTETASSKQTSSRREAESLIVNVAGRLLMLQRDRSTTSGKENGDIRKREKMLPFCAPVVLASCVENMWSSSRSSPDKVHLSEALWLGCGAAGMKVWLPLFPRNDEKRHSFLSKRIMLPFQLNIYPLAVLFEDAVVLGAANDTMKYDFQDCSSPSALDSTPTRLFPFNVVDRTTQVYLHHIVRELLRRNLGSHALQIAKSCRSLPYFSHVLELLLHQVLEEEATASEPIPDPLLPRIVDFIREFPEFLQTIVHCARKTEIALWSYLFASAGNPKDLFEQCLQSGSLETASSYLIILQNLEPAAISRQHATLLLDASLDKGKWELAKDLVRFLRAIGNEDPESPPRTPVNPINAPMYPLPPPPQDGPFPGFAFGSQARPVRSYSMGENLAGVRERGSAIERERERERHHSVQATSTTNKKTTAAPKDIPPRADCGVFMGTLKHLEETAEHFFIDVILQRHARKLLSAGRLRELGSFAAHLNFELIGWLQKERCRAARVDDFVTSLHTLHRDFQWPMPVIALSQVLSRSNSGERSRSSSYEALEVGVNGMTLSDISEGPNRLRPNGMYASPSLRSSMDLLCDELRQEALDSRQFNSNQKGDNGSTAATETSEMSASIVADDSELTLDDSMWNLANLDELEALSQELACRGPPHCETQLRYLLHVMMEAGCLEWAMLISLVLRDSMGVTRVVNTASLTDMPIDVVGRMREGLSYLELWADTECPGYKPFLLVIRGQAEVLTGIVDIQGSPQVTPIPTPESSLTSADFHALGFHGNSSDKEDPESEEQKSVVETDLPQDGGQCALS